MADKALATARSFLSGSICTCGHTNGEHVFEHGSDGSPEVKRCRPGCTCKLYRPVEFVIRRRKR